jgi:excisionase family DNA binding protein
MTKSSQTNRGPRFLTVKETADLLNYDERTIRRWISSGALEAHRPGREWRIARKALDEFLALSSNRRFSSVL